VTVFYHPNILLFVMETTPGYWKSGEFSLRRRKMEKNKSGIRSFHFQYEHERALKKMHQSQDGMWTANMPTAVVGTKTAVIETTVAMVVALAAAMGTYYLFGLDEQVLASIRNAMF